MKNAEKCAISHYDRRRYSRERASERVLGRGPHRYLSILIALDGRPLGRRALRAVRAKPELRHFDRKDSIDREGARSFREASETGPFSAVSTPIVMRNGAFFSIFQNLQEFTLFS